MKWWFFVHAYLYELKVRWKNYETMVFFSQTEILLSKISVSSEKTDCCSNVLVFFVIGFLNWQANGNLEPIVFEFKSLQYYNIVSLLHQYYEWRNNNFRIQSKLDGNHPYMTEVHFLVELKKHKFAWFSRSNFCRTNLRM